MKKKTNKYIALILVLVLSITMCPLTAQAGSIGSVSFDETAGTDSAQNAKTTYNTGTVNTGISTDVYLTIDDSDIIVSVPTLIIINGAPDENGNYTGTYSVSASGDISADKLVQIKPKEDNIQLIQKGKQPKTAAISQDRTRFDSEDLMNQVMSSGLVTANALTAGSWKAETSFELKITTKSDYDPIPDAALLAENKDTKTYEDYDLFEHGHITSVANNKWTVTSNIENDIISTKMLYLPYGSAIKFDTAALKAKGYNENPDIRLYRYTADKAYIGEITSAVLAPNSDNVDTDFRCTNFVVSDKEGMYVKVRWIKWNNTFNENSKKDLQSVFAVHSLTKINAEIFDSNTLSQCWNNEAAYEAWPSKCILYNPNNKLYYAFYASQSSHTNYDGKILYRTSEDLNNWSDSTVIWDSNINEYPSSINGAFICSNGDIMVSMLCDSSGNNSLAKTRHLRSSDNGITWDIEDFILDGENMTGTYRTNRERILEDGRIFSCYFDGAKKEKVGICYSEDNGHTWSSSEFSTKFDLNDNGEYDFTLLNNGNILCIERTPNGVAASISIDNGQSFINETSLTFICGNQFTNCPFIRYDKENDRLTIYEVDRFSTGGLVGVYTSGKSISEFLLDGKEFNGFQANACSLGLNGTADMGYPHIIDAPDGTIKCFYYNRNNQEAGTAAWHSVSTAKY